MNLPQKFVDTLFLAIFAFERSLTLTFEIVSRWIFHRNS